MIYIIVFVSSLVILRFSFIFKNKAIRLILRVIALLIPCVLASLRSPRMTIDTAVYIEPLFRQAKMQNLTQFVFNNTITHDIGYLLVTYLVSQLSKNVAGMFFAISVLVIIPAYLAIKKRYKTPRAIVVGMMILYVLLYNASFNMARQSISLSLGTLAISYLLKNEDRKFLIYSIIALLFHWSAFVLLLIYVIWVSYRKDYKKIRIFLLAMLVMGLVLVNILPSLLSLVGLGQTKIANYILSHSTNSYTSNATADTMYFIYVCIMCKTIIPFDEKKREKAFCLFLMIAGLIVMQYGSYIEYGFRLSYYFIYPCMMLIVPNLFEANSKKQALLPKVILLASLGFYWCFWTVIANYHGTYPYIMANY